jgi:hypothetical protein
MRFSEVSVQGDDLWEVAQVYRHTVRLALDLGVREYVTWGVKGEAWNGGKLLFDSKGQPNEVYWAVADEINLTPASPKGEGDWREDDDFI